MKRTISLILSAALLLACLPLASAEETALKVKMLTIVQEPDKTEYVADEEFDPTGTVINVTMSDGSVQENVEWKCKQKKPLTTKDKAVTFTYGGKTVMQKITVKNRGNTEPYSVACTEALPDSPLQGMTILWLGSSVTYGYGSDGESMVEFMDKRDGTVSIKEAVSGTTLADIDDPKKGASYVKRLEALIASDECPTNVDVFICQLSTNDMYDAETFGAVTEADVTDKTSFDKSTTYGAMEYITALVKETWNCPIFFYTNAKMENVNYGHMVEALYQIAEKWDIGVIDLFTDTAFNAISSEDYALYMTDNVHPTKAGYRDWWLVKFEEALYALKAE